MSNLGDARENFLRTAGKPILDALKAPLQDLIQFVQTGLPIVIENFGKFFNRMKENQAVIWIIAGAVMGALVPALYASATALRANIVALAPFIAAGAAIA